MGPEQQKEAKQFFDDMNKSAKQDIFYEFNDFQTRFSSFCPAGISKQYEALKDALKPQVDPNNWIFFKLFNDTNVKMTGVMIEQFEQFCDYDAGQKYLCKKSKCPNKLLVIGVKKEQGGYDQLYQ